MNRVAYSIIASLALAAGSQAEGQVIVRNIGVLGPGSNVHATVQFATGGEVYVGVAEILPNPGLEFDLSGSTADTEIAIYGPGGRLLLACNDDGGIDSATGASYGLSSYIWAGLGAPVDPGSAYYGPTCPSNAWDDDSQAIIYVGQVLFVINTFAISWDEANASDTGACGGPGSSSGTGAIRISILP